MVRSRLALLGLLLAAAMTLGSDAASAAPPVISFKSALHYNLPFAWPSVRGLAVGDVNGDGHQDFVVLGFGGALAVFLNNGSGGFDDPSFIDGDCPNSGGVVNGVAGVAIGHFTNSGHEDLLVGCDYALVDGLVRYPGNGDGTFGDPQRIAPVQAYSGENDQRQPTYVGIGMGSLVHGTLGGAPSVAWAEYQAGGGIVLCMMLDSEIAATTTGDRAITRCSIGISPQDVYDPLGSMEWEPPLVLGTLPFPNPASSWVFTNTPQDEGLNNDSMRGSVYDSSAPFPFSAGFSWNDIEPTHAMTSQPSLLAAGDLNGDGYSELISDNGDGSKVGVYQLANYTDSAGVLLVPDPTLYATSPTMDSMYGAVTGDFDGDGHLDVAVLGGVTPSVHSDLEVFPGDGTGALGTAQSFDLADFVSDSYLATGNFNGDGRADVVAIVGQQIDVLLGAVPPPSITSFSPTAGAPGSSVTVTGTSLGGTTAVKLAGAPASFSQISSTQVSFTVPAGAKTGHIAVTTPGGTGTSSGIFSVVVPPPVVFSFSPLQGHEGDTVTINGSHFTGASSVAFNGINASTYTVVSDGTISATVPAGAKTGRIAVSTPYGMGKSAASFVVLPPAPDITSFTPTHGKRGTKVTISGSGFTGAKTVAFNGVKALFTVVSDGTITTFVPFFGTTGKVTVTTAGGVATSAATFSVP